MKIPHAFIGALALACSSAPALSQIVDTSQSIYIASSDVLPHQTAAARSRGSSHAGSAPFDIRTNSQLVAVARRYVGSRRFTRYARAWCADALGAWLRQAGYSSTGDGRAISYARYGRPSGPHVGAIAVMRHHVGIVIGYSARGPILLSGNHGHRVGVGVYSAHRVFSYREPV